jgi:hypothetical protein
VILLTPKCHILNQNPVHFVEIFTMKKLVATMSLLVTMESFSFQPSRLFSSGEICKNKTNKHQQDPEPLQQIQTEKLVGA